MKKPHKIIVQSPGRINLIGEHTDYTGGFVLPAAIDKKITVEIERNGTDSLAEFGANDIGETFQFDLTNFSRLKSGWQNYVMGVIAELQKLGGKMQGFNASFGGDVPIGGGMSSSAALECSLAFALNELFELNFSKKQLYFAAQKAEHNYVGIKCGIMDQFASVMGKKDHVMLLDCHNLTHQYFPLDLGDFEILLLNTGVSHALADSAFNDRVAACTAGLEYFQKIDSKIQTLRDVTLEMLNKHKSGFSDEIFKRCSHVINENQRVLDATKALSQNDIPLLGTLMYASHHSLQHVYDVSCAELDFLVDTTRENDHVLGSRMMGGGFGGCTINLVHSAHSELFIKKTSTLYKQNFNLNLEVYRVCIEDGTKVLA